MRPRDKELILEALEFYANEDDTDIPLIEELEGVIERAELLATGDLVPVGIVTRRTFEVALVTGDHSEILNALQGFKHPPRTLQHVPADVDEDDSEATGTVTRFAHEQNELDAVSVSALGDRTWWVAWWWA